MYNKYKVNLGQQHDNLSYWLDNIIGSLEVRCFFQIEIALKIYGEELKFEYYS